MQRHASRLTFCETRSAILGVKHASFILAWFSLVTRIRISLIWRGARGRRLRARCVFGFWNDLRRLRPISAGCTNGGIQRAGSGAAAVKIDLVRARSRTVPRGARRRMPDRTGGRRRRRLPKREIARTGLTARWRSLPWTKRHGLIVTCPGLKGVEFADAHSDSRSRSPGATAPMVSWPDRRRRQGIVSTMPAVGTDRGRFGNIKSAVCQDLLRGQDRGAFGATPGATSPVCAWRATSGAIDSKPWAGVALPDSACTLREFHAVGDAGTGRRTTSKDKSRNIIELAFPAYEATRRCLTGILALILPRRVW